MSGPTDVKINLRTYLPIEKDVDAVEINESLKEGLATILVRESAVAPRKRIGNMTCYLACPTLKSKVNPFCRTLARCEA